MYIVFNASEPFKRVTYPVNLRFMCTALKGLTFLRKPRLNPFAHVFKTSIANGKNSWHDNRQCTGRPFHCLEVNQNTVNKNMFRKLTFFLFNIKTWIYPIFLIVIQPYLITSWKNEAIKSIILLRFRLFILVSAFCDEVCACMRNHGEN